MTATPRGLHELEILRLSPPVAGQGPITLELAPGLGLVRPGDQVERRKPGRPESDDLLLLDLADAVPADLAGWLDRRYVVEPAADSRDCVGRARTGTHGALCVYTNRARIEEAIDTGRRARSAWPSASTTEREGVVGMRAALSGVGVPQMVLTIM